MKRRSRNVFTPPTARPHTTPSAGDSETKDKEVSMWKDVNKINILYVMYHVQDSSYCIWYHPVHGTIL